MSKKQPDTTGILNELTGQSAFFKNPEEKSERPIRPDEPDRSDGPERIERPVRVQQKKRAIRRQSYELYDDQGISLQKLKVEFMLQGELKSMSSMVREAIDEYLEKHKNRTVPSSRTPRTE